MLTYLLKSTILLALLYGSFALLLSRETFHRFNRLALLSVLVASLVLPAVQLSLNMPAFLNSLLVADSPATITIGEGTATIAGEGSPASEHPVPALTWMSVVKAVYFIGVLASFLVFAVQLLRFWHEVKGGLRTKDEQGNTVIIRGGDFAPYSFFHYIIIDMREIYR